MLERALTEVTAGSLLISTSEVLYRNEANCPRVVMSLGLNFGAAGFVMLK